MPRPPAAPSCTPLYQPLTGIPQPGVLAQGLASYQIDRPMVLQQVSSARCAPGLLPTGHARRAAPAADRPVAAPCRPSALQLKQMAPMGICNAIQDQLIFGYCNQQAG